MLIVFFYIRTVSAIITLAIINKNQSQPMKSRIKTIHQLSFDNRIYPRHEPDNNNSFQATHRNQLRPTNLCSFQESMQASPKKTLIFRSDQNNYSFCQQTSKLGSRPVEYLHNGPRVSYENVQTSRNRVSLGYIPPHCEKTFNKSISVALTKQDEEKQKNISSNNYRLHTSQGKILDFPQKNNKCQQHTETIGTPSLYGNQKTVYQNTRKQNENGKLNGHIAAEKQGLENSPTSKEKNYLFDFKREFVESDKMKIFTNEKKVVFNPTLCIPQLISPMIKNNDQFTQLSTNNIVQNGCGKQQQKISSREQDQQIQDLLLQISRQNQTKTKLREQIIELKKKIAQIQRQNIQMSKKLAQLEMIIVKNQEDKKRSNSQAFTQIKQQLDRYILVNKQLENALQQQKNKTISSNFLNSKLQNTIILQEKRISILQNHLQQSLLKLKDVQRQRSEERRQFSQSTLMSQKQIQILIQQSQNLKKICQDRLQNCKNSLMDVFDSFSAHINQIQNQLLTKSRTYIERSQKLNVLVQDARGKIKKKHNDQEFMIRKLYEYMLNVFESEQEQSSLNPESLSLEKNEFLINWQKITNFLSGLAIKIRQNERKTYERMSLKDYQMKETVDNNSELVEINHTLAKQYKRVIENLQIQQKQIKELELSIQNNQSILREYELKIRSLQIYNYEISEVCKETNEILLVSNLKLLNQRLQQNSKNVSIVQLI